MHNHYRLRLSVLLLSSSIIFTTSYAQKPVSSKEIRLTDFAMPPYPIELISLSLSSGESGSQVQYQTLMPIAGRVAPKTDPAKMRGAEVSPSGVYLYKSTVNAQNESGEGTVFSPPNPRVKLDPATPVDWAVWGTNAKDGPLRLPFGGNYDQLTTTLPSHTGRQIKQMAFGATEAGLNYANYSLYPRYRSLTRTIDPTRGQPVTQLAETTPKKEQYVQKLLRYIPIDSPMPWKKGRVITLAPDRFEGVATRFVEGDKNASSRQVSLLTFDSTGTLVKDQPVNFPFNRSFSTRLPIHDLSGKPVGTLTLFGDGPGKKEARDPEENHVSVIATNEQGDIWSQFEWTTGGSSVRAAMPTYALRKGEQLLVFSTNQQKLLKPVEETWLFDKSGKATLISSLPSGDITDLSKAIGSVNGGERTGWMNFFGSQYIDSFSDTNGDTWVILQRQVDAPLVREQASTPSASTTASRLMGYASRLNQMTSQSAPAASLPARGADSDRYYGDLFVLRFDSNLKFKEQTVIATEPTPEPLTFKRLFRSMGTDYVFNDAATTRMSFRNGKLAVQPLAPAGSVRLSTPGINNFVLNEAGNTIYVLVGVSKKPGYAQLLTYSLD